MPPIFLWQLTPASPFAVNLTDMSSLDAVTAQYPPGLYSTFRTFGNGTRVLGLRAHLERLYRPSGGGSLLPPVLEREMRRQLHDLLAEFCQAQPEARVRLILSGSGEFLAALEPLHELPAQVYTSGVPVITTGVQRCDPRRKSTAFITQSAGERSHLHVSGQFEALIVRRGWVLEGMTSNFFYVQAGRLGTARRGILLGVTRATVLRLARRLGLPVDYHPLQLKALQEVDEAFITSSSRGVVPVVQIDGMPVGSGAVGPLTRQLGAAYNAYVQRHAELIAPIRQPS